MYRIALFLLIAFSMVRCASISESGTAHFGKEHLTFNRLFDEENLVVIWLEEPAWQERQLMNPIRAANKTERELWRVQDHPARYVVLVDDPSDSQPGVAISVEKEEMGNPAEYWRGKLGSTDNLGTYDHATKVMDLKYERLGGPGKRIIRFK